jgi:hypothetical protein
MVQSLGSLIAELESAKRELRELFETRSGVTEEQNGKVEKTARRPKVLLSNRNMPIQLRTEEG